MTTKAHAEFDPQMLGVRIHVRRENGGPAQGLHWAPVVVSQITEATADRLLDDDVWLRLPEDDARAIYEALADHFGHSGNDTRALRRDYDAERGRVDRLIAHLVSVKP